MIGIIFRDHSIQFCICAENVLESLHQLLPIQFSIVVSIVHVEQLFHFLQSFSRFVISEHCLGMSPRSWNRRHIVKVFHVRSQSVYNLLTVQILNTHSRRSNCCFSHNFTIHQLTYNFFQSNIARHICQIFMCLMYLLDVGSSEIQNWYFLQFYSFFGLIPFFLW